MGWIFHLVWLVRSMSNSTYFCLQRCMLWDYFCLNLHSIALWFYISKHWWVCIWATLFVKFIIKVGFFPISIEKVFLHFDWKINQDNENRIAIAIQIIPPFSSQKNPILLRILLIVGGVLNTLQLFFPTLWGLFKIRKSRLKKRLRNLPKITGRRRWSSLVGFTLFPVSRCHHAAQTPMSTCISWGSCKVHRLQGGTQDSALLVGSSVMMRQLAQGPHFE